MGGTKSELPSEARLSYNGTLGRLFLHTRCPEVYHMITAAQLW